MPTPRTQANKYGLAAAKAVALCRDNPGLTPPMAWEKAAAEFFVPGTPAQRKGCPKNTFLGLCEDGHIQGIPPGDYIRPRKYANKGYATAALAVLQRQPELADSPLDLWARVRPWDSMTHNEQMTVVVTLWKSRLLKRR
jgi:uncharacterized protein DUF6979